MRVYSHEKSGRTEEVGVQLTSEYSANSMPRDRIQQVRNPRGITLEIRIGHSLAAPV